MELERDNIEMGDKLGDGASGDVFAATLEGQAVAVKVCHEIASSWRHGCILQAILDQNEACDYPPCTVPQ